MSHLDPPMSSPKKFLLELSLFTLIFMIGLLAYENQKHVTLFQSNQVRSTQFAELGSRVCTSSGGNFTNLIEPEEVGNAVGTTGDKGSLSGNATYAIVECRDNKPDSKYILLTRSPDSTIMTFDGKWTLKPYGFFAFSDKIGKITEPSSPSVEAFTGPDAYAILLKRKQTLVKIGLTDLPHPEILSNQATGHYGSPDQKANEHETIRQENELRRTAFHACSDRPNEITLKVKSAARAMATSTTDFRVLCGSKLTRAVSREVTIVLSQPFDLTTSILTDEEYEAPIL